jgi:hypothetical protein
MRRRPFAFQQACEVCGQEAFLVKARNVDALVCQDCADNEPSGEPDCDSDIASKANSCESEGT